MIPPLLQALQEIKTSFDLKYLINQATFVLPFFRSLCRSGQAESNYVIIYRMFYSEKYFFFVFKCIDHFSSKLQISQKLDTLCISFFKSLVSRFNNIIPIVIF